MCVTADEGRWRSRPVDEAGTPSGPVPAPGAFPAAAASTDRVVWAGTAACYPPLRAQGLRVGRCHDLTLAEGLILGHEGRWGAERSPAAAWARLRGDMGHGPPEGRRSGPAESDGGVVGPGIRVAGSGGWGEGAQPALFEPDAPAGGLPAGVDPLEVVVAVHADQQARITTARATSPGFGLLVAAESAAALAAVEMTEAGLPWRADLHDQLLEAALGPRPVHGGRPPRMQALAEEIGAILGRPRLNPDSQPDLLAALRRNGVPVRSTRRHELRGIDHPVVEPLLKYRELARLHAANGWAWREQWVRDGRFRPEYVPGGVVTGRWASRGGGALQIPRAVRAAVVAEPGRVLVVADAGQLEPRVLAAMSGDRHLIAATQQGDLYAALAAQALGRPQARAEAKLGMLSAMYGGGAGSVALTALRRRFPTALDLLQTAARAGEAGGSVRSVLGRVSPPAGHGWLDGLPPDRAAARARAYGRFTRNFVVQASAADWASVLLADLRTRLHALPGGCGPDPARLVFFQHDEVLVEAPAELAEAVVTAIHGAGAEATRLVLGDVGVQVPLDAAAVRSYADKHSATRG
ncbi:MAG TPA: bifunctional 3'-5' exonuclease/DNA polymerase [Kineosporiaceae bacterium]